LVIGVSLGIAFCAVVSGFAAMKSNKSPYGANVNRGGLRSEW
jgi:hypothetical protein